MNTPNPFLSGSFCFTSQFLLIKNDPARARAAAIAAGYSAADADRLCILTRQQDRLGDWAKLYRPGDENPFKEKTKNHTLQAILTLTDPKTAARLKADAKA